MPGIPLYNSWARGSNIDILDCKGGRDREKANEPRVGNRKHCRREMRLQRGLEMGGGREGRTDCEERGRENGARGPWNSDVVGRFSDSFVWSTLRKGETDKKRRAGRPGEFLDSSVGGPCRGDEWYARTGGLRQSRGVGPAAGFALTRGGKTGPDGAPTSGM